MRRKDRPNEYDIWYGIWYRCTNVNCKGFKFYGGMGVTICDRWKKFANFYADMGPRPSPKHSVDRVDPNGNYEPSNCRWATPTQQIRNRRNASKLTKDGVTKSLKDWTDELGVHASAVSSRMVRGWSDEQALSVPVRKRKKGITFSETPSRHKKIISLYTSGLSVSEVAKLVGVVPSAVKYALKKGRVPLRRDLDAELRKQWAHVIPECETCNSKITTRHGRSRYIRRGYGFCSRECHAISLMA